MKAITEKYEELKAAAKSIGISDNLLSQWKVRGEVPGYLHIKLIDNSEGRLSISDFRKEA